MVTERCQNRIVDFELMRRIERQDPAALGSLYDRYAAMVFTLAFRMLRDRADADELVSDVFLELWRRADRFDPNRGVAVSYLMTLARCRAIDRRRIAASRAQWQVAAALGPEMRSPHANPAEFAVSAENARMVRDALCDLDPVYRQAVELSFFDGLSHKQVAHRLNKPLGTVKTHIRQGLIQLRDSLRKDAQ